MCIDFTDLNRACPKDSFPLPRIDAMIDSTSGCELMSFLDAFQGYNQIRSSDKGLPFFKILKKADAFSWNEQCQAAFENLKKYLTSPPLLTKPKPGETLFLYLAISEGAVSAVLVRGEAREHQPIYYVSKTLQGPEERYPQIEKLALALVTAARKLRPYFQSHPVVVLTNHPLKKILANPNISGRMVKWSIELSEHDGSATSQGSGAGVIIETPQGDRLQYAIKFNFAASNNEAEYEALIAGEN
ncbi:UNVERIFIED_CONTAM: hypothetical protein Sradi_3132400 [Sesamum radiatum]|uniref:Reverse transcriptase/retrotransposon-derived protein RNase H-like domain-containing protein n=1 Tax=Sesamum radiatum TaxID=300843 RepID=A0AAW2RE64_SESRA